jgi:type II secretory pathway component PulF
MEFEYTVINKEGERLKSMMKADSAAAVASILRNSGGKPLKITPVKKEKSFDFLEGFFSGSKQVTSNEVVVFTRQLGTILSAGVLLTEALQTIANDMENKYFASVIQDVIYQINSGENFSKALSKHPICATRSSLSVLCFLLSLALYCS